MVVRIVCLVLAMGILAGCYNVPQPECGFACGPAGACPGDYACNMAVNRCQLMGTSPSCAPAPGLDAGMDTIRDSQDDFFPPMVVDSSRSPAPDATAVPLDSVISLAFSEEVVGVHGGSFTLEANGSTVSALVNPFPTSATLRPTSPLLPSTVYTVRVLSSIADLAGNPLVMPSVWQFTTGSDMVPPFVMLRSPAINATGVGVGAAIFVDFSEEVTGVTSSSFVVSTGGAPIAGTVNYMTGTRRAELVKAIQLAPNTTYTVSLSSAIRDTASNPLSAVSWTFTTGPDQQAPMVVARTPAAASAGVPVSTQVTASFDENVMTISGTTFTLTPMGGSPVAAVVMYAAGTRTATLTPELQLAPNTQHTAMLSAAITDTSGNPFASTSWTFTTGADTVGPRVALTSPADLATAVPTSSTITVQFDEPVQNVSTTTFTVNGGAIPGTIALSANATVATFSPDAALPPSATISVNLTTAITDTIGNALATPSAFSFMTGP